MQYPFSTDIEEGGIPPDGSQEILVDFDPGYKAGGFFWPNFCGTIFSFFFFFLSYVTLDIAICFFSFFNVLKLVVLTRGSVVLNGPNFWKTVTPPKGIANSPTLKGRSLGGSVCYDMLRLFQPDVLTLRMLKYASLFCDWISDTLFVFQPTWLTLKFSCHQNGEFFRPRKIPDFNVVHPVFCARWIGRAGPWSRAPWQPH